VEDNGSGLDPAAVPPECIGLRISLLERMPALDGGSANTMSGAGGTRATLAWRR